MSTRPKRVSYFLLSIITIGILFSPFAAYADQLITGPTVFPPPVPLLITAYEMKTGGVDVALMEIYSLDDTVIDMTQFSIIDETNGRSLQFSARGTPGYILPDTHVVLSADGVIEDDRATYRIDGWQQTDDALSPVAVKTMSIEREGYKPADVAIKASNTAWFRTYNTSSYSTSSSLSTDVFKGETRILFDDGLYVAPAEAQGLEVSEVYAYASDCSPFQFETDSLCSDFIELHNNSTTTVLDLSDLVLRTDSNSSSRSVSNTFTLSGVLAPDDYLLINRTDDGGQISLTNTGGYIWLEDAWGLVVPYNTMMTEWPSISSDLQGYSYVGGDGVWQWTARPTPGDANIHVEPTVAPAVCDEGYERNLATNRCRKIVSTTSTLTPCMEGQERNPATNRCRSIASAVAELIPCDEGYERNPATNRCRKAQSASVPSVPFAVEPVDVDTPIWQWWVGGAIAAGLAGYAVWEWRHELGKLWSRISKR